MSISFLACHLQLFTLVGQNLYQDLGGILLLDGLSLSAYSQSEGFISIIDFSLENLQKMVYESLTKK